MAPDRDDEFDRYDFEYTPDADERDLVEHDAAAELDAERRDLMWEEHRR